MYLDKIVLSLKFVPAIILYALLPRSFLYMIKNINFVLALLFFIIFSLSGIMYILYRSILVYKINKFKMWYIYVGDSVLMIIGVLLACYLSEMSDSWWYYLLIVTSVPFLINNGICKRAHNFNK